MRSRAIQATAIFCSVSSGTGKTQFGRYLAYTMGVLFCYFNLSRMVDSLMGGTSKNLNKVFNYIKGTPCVFMIDELDAISSNRARSDSTSASGEMNHTTISLMQNLDQLSSDVVLLAATNRPELVDDAVKRRFSIRPELQVFSPDELLCMAEQFLADDLGSQRPDLTAPTENFSCFVLFYIDIYMHIC